MEGVRNSEIERKIGGNGGKAATGETTSVTFSFRGFHRVLYWLFSVKGAMHQSRIFLPLLLINSFFRVLIFNHMYTKINSVHANKKISQIFNYTSR